MVRADLCIYLNEEEYKKLEAYLLTKKNVLKGYVWKLTSMDKNEQYEYDAVKSEQTFYTKEDTLTEGAHQSAYHDKPTQLEVVEEWLPVPDELKFYSKCICMLFTRHACS